MHASVAFIMYYSVFNECVILCPKSKFVFSLTRVQSLVILGVLEAGQNRIRKKTLNDLGLAEHKLETD